MSKPRVKKYAVAIFAVVEVPEDLKIGITTTRGLIRATDSGIREGIEAQFGDEAVIRGDLKVAVKVAP